MAGFRYLRTYGASRDQLMENMQMAASVTGKDGDAMTLTNGKLAAATISSTQVDYVLAEDKTSGATDVVKPKVVRARGNTFQIGFTPLLDKVACLSGGTTTSIVHNTTGYSANDFQYGLLFSHSTNEVRVISASAATTGTLTVVEPLSRALTTSDKISVIPFGLGASPKLATVRTVDSAIANKTGGPLVVLDVDFLKKQLDVEFK